MLTWQVHVRWLRCYAGFFCSGTAPLKYVRKYSDLGWYGTRYHEHVRPCYLLCAFSTFPHVYEYKHEKYSTQTDFLVPENQKSKLDQLVRFVLLILPCHR
jgi:hypothetical protein